MKMDNVSMLHHTLDIIARGSYESAGGTVKLLHGPEALQEAKVYMPDAVEAMCAENVLPDLPSPTPCVTRCVNADTYSHARRLSADMEDSSLPVLVLNLANPVHPGGGVRRGSNAQEEDLCRKSSLLVSLESEAAKPYYEYNKALNTFMGSDAIILSPTVEIIKDDMGDLLPCPVTVAVLTCAAPMITFGLEGMSDTEYRDMFRSRIRRMLACAAYLGYRTFVPGAWGCGAFGNDAAVISDLFREALESLSLGGFGWRQLFTRLDFAVLCRRNLYNYEEFARNFGCDDTAPAADPVLFWHEYETNGGFSNWYMAPFEIDGFTYHSVEQYMMARKAMLFRDEERFVAILKAETPERCKRLGRDVTPYDDASWFAIARDVVREACLAKFRQNPDLKLDLLATGTRPIAEASPFDRVWGIGLDAAEAVRTPMHKWPGRNLLGHVLMEVRQILREE